MSRLKNMSRAGLVVTGIVIALLLVPTGAAAKGLKIAGIIEGTSGNKADVTTTGNLKVAVASPANFFYQEDVTGPGSGFDSPAVTPPAGTDLIMTIIHLNVFSDPAPGSASSIDLFVAPSTACNTGAGPYFQSVNPAGIGEQDVSLDPGVGVPSGDVLCAGEFGSVQAKLDVSGYTVTAHSITAGPVHLLPRDPGGR